MCQDGSSSHRGRGGGTCGGAGGGAGGSRMACGRLETTFCGADRGDPREVSGLCSGTLQVQLEGQGSQGKRESEIGGHSTVNMHIMAFIQ